MGSVLRAFPSPVSRGTVVELGTIDLYPESSIRGDIRSRSGEALSGYEISIAVVDSSESIVVDRASAWLSSSRRRWSSRDGSVVFDRLVGGLYRVDARYLNPDGGRWAEYATVEIAAEQASEEFHFVVDESLSIRGLLLDAQGRPANRAWVSLRRDVSLRAINTMTTAHDGGFYFSSIAPGQYSIVAGMDPRLRSSDGSDYSAGQCFTGILAGEQDLVLQLMKAGGISGFVVDANHEAVANYWVCAISPENAIIDQTTTDPTGAFSLPGVGQAVDVMVIPSRLHPKNPTQLVADNTEGLTVVEAMVLPGTSELLIILPYPVIVNAAGDKGSPPRLPAASVGPHEQPR